MPICTPEFNREGIPAGRAFDGRCPPRSRTFSGSVRVPQLPSDHGYYHLSDGKVILMIAPGKLSYFRGMGIEKPKLDQIGFTVESLDAVEKDLAWLVGSNSSARAIAQGAESEGRLRLLSACKYGRRHIPDPDGTLIDIRE